MKPVPARLHVLLANDSSSAVIIRRGPSRHTAAIGWNRRNDTFKIGQWLYGRIYERRCDISPDGRYLIYFAMNGRWESKVKGSWTAISEAPYLKALTLYAKGDCWHGGGLFISRNTYWLNDGYGHEPQLSHSKLIRTVEYPWHESYGGECPGVYYVRLQRNGWIMKQTSSNLSENNVSIFEKHVHAYWLLRKRAHSTLHHPVGKGCYFDEHELCNIRTGETIDGSTWEWADMDGRRIVWTTGGKLFAARLGTKGLGAIKELQDFTDLRFENLKAPY